uniref:Variant surface glycoprotein 1125.155 n=1 Tax=Trypanosoma brucei TaxID=5691 RepID=A0A1J0R586_9TRYP|nr:variant surface glycoprotein 1125.155 [Trypanosoma brucei]
MAASAIQALALAALLATTKAAASNIGDGDNAREHAILCQLLALTTGTPALDKTLPALAGVPQDLLDLNMSLADSSWTKMLTDDDGSPKSFPEDQLASKDYKDDWKGKWQTWANTATRLKKNQEAKYRLAAAGVNTLTETQRHYARLRVQNLLNETAAIAERTHLLANAVSSITQQTITAKLDEAEFGTAAAKAKYAANAGSGNPYNQNRGCANGGTVGEDQPLAYLVLCTCVSGATTQQKKACIKNVDINQQWDTIGAGNAKAAYEDIKKTCTLNGKAQITAQQIRSALQATRGLIRRDDTTGYFGKLESGGSCTGDSNSGMCVKYTDYVTGDNDKYDEIKWVAALRQAAKDLESREEKLKQWQILNEHLQTAAAKAWLISSEAKLIASTQVTPAAPEKHAAKKAPDCTQYHNKSKECTDNGCQWEGKSETDGKCIVDESKVKEQTNAPAGTGEQTSKCTGLDSKEKCEGVQGTPAPGKKSVCWWITYEECEGTLEKPYCRDYSFLLNKKLALMTASFMMAF